MFVKGKNSELVKFKGKFTYVYYKGLNKFDKWSLEFYPDRDSLDRIRDLQAEGVKNVIKKNDDNEYHVQISRLPFVEFVKGQKESVQPPTITFEGKPFDGGIGNGSDGTCICEVYSHKVPSSDTKRAKAMRWYGLEIENLVPFEMPAQAPAEEEKKEESIW